MKREHKIDLIIGAVLMAAGAAVEIFWSGMYRGIPSLLIGSGIALLIHGAYKYWRYGDLPEHDERTKKLTGSALALTLLVLLISVFILMLMNRSGMLDMTVSQVLSVIFLIMILVLNISLWYFSRKGDME